MLPRGTRAALQCDFLTATSRKYLRGPRGVGFLYANPKLTAAGFEPAMLDVWGATWHSREGYRLAPGARRFEQYEVSFAGKVGLGVAVEYALDVGVERIWARVRHLAGRLRERLVRRTRPLLITAAMRMHM